MPAMDILTGMKGCGDSSQTKWGYEWKQKFGAVLE